MEKLIKKIDKYLDENQRVILAIAAPPAAGKSTLSKKLLNHYENSVVVPMDGFHLDNNILKNKSLINRKGAPETFDSEGFVSLISRIAKGKTVYAPEFDRKIDLSKAGAIEIANQRLIIVEGNYLLFDKQPWNKLTKFWTISAWLDVPIEVIEERCINRWLEHGYSLEDAKERAYQNDVTNAKVVLNNRLKADVVL